MVDTSRQSVDSKQTEKQSKLWRLPPFVKPASCQIHCRGFEHFNQKEVSNLTQCYLNHKYMSQDASQPLLLLCERLLAGGGLGRPLSPRLGLDGDLGVQEGGQSVTTEEEQCDYCHLGHY